MFAPVVRIVRFCYFAFGFSTVGIALVIYVTITTTCFLDRDDVIVTIKCLGNGWWCTAAGTAVACYCVLLFDGAGQMGGDIASAFATENVAMHTCSK